VEVFGEPAAETRQGFSNGPTLALPELARERHGRTAEAPDAVLPAVLQMHGSVSSRLGLVEYGEAVASLGVRP